MTTPVQTRQPQALDDLAFWLAIQHQEAQQQIANSTAAGLALLWGALQFARLDETTPAWLHGVTLQVEQKFRESEQAAFDFVQGSKWAVEPLSAPLRKIDTVFPTKDFQLAMRATGPATVKRGSAVAFAPPESDSERLFSGFPPEVQQANLDRLADDLLGRGKLNSTGAGVKFALNGGRGEVQQLVISDARERIRNRQTIGWARFTEDSDTGPCYFCALLASRGAKYLDATSFDVSSNRIREPVPEDRRRGNARTTRRAFLGDGVAKVHDHCKCSLRPVYREQDSMDARAKYFLRQYKKMFKDSPWLSSLEGSEDMKQWRKVYKRPPPYEVRPVVSLAAVRRNRELVAQELGAGSDHVRWWDRTIRRLEAAN
jgi:hypothetical protein